MKIIGEFPHFAENTSKLAGMVIFPLFIQIFPLFAENISEPAGRIIFRVFIQECHPLFLPFLANLSSSLRVFGKLITMMMLRISRLTEFTMLFPEHKS